MQPLSDDIVQWCDETWGQSPSEILEWFEDDERVQVFIKLPRSVLVADFVFKENLTPSTTNVLSVFIK